jgi:hypothetical protein
MDMKSIRLFFVIQVLVIVTGCRHMETSRQAGADSTSAARRPMVKQQTAIKPNTSSVSGIITALELVDSLRYKVSIQVNSSLPEGSMENFAEPGQQIVAAPQFFLSGSGFVDTTVERNKRLLGIRTARSGDMFIGKISLTAKGNWVIVDVESNNR